MKSEIIYDISTGSKSEFYTLWATTTIDLRPRDENGNITEDFRRNSIGGNMYYHVYINFRQNLGKTPEAAKAKVKELGLNIPDDAFSFDLKHYSKPSFEAFGVKMKYKTGKWYARATPEFFECWKAMKEEMKAMGWSCWSYQNGLKKEWYMGVKLNNN